MCVYVHPERGAEGSGSSTHQQDAYCHHGRSSGGNGAVHKDDMIFADVFGQTQVMQLGKAAGGGERLPWLQKQEGYSYHRDMLRGGEKGDK